MVMDMKYFSGKYFQKLYLAAQLHQIACTRKKGIATLMRRRYFTWILLCQGELLSELLGWLMVRACPRARIESCGEIVIKKAP